MSRNATELSIDSVLGRDYVWGLQYRYKGDVAMVLEMKLWSLFYLKNECRVRTRVHIGIQKKAGNIPILSRCVGTTLRIYIVWSVSKMIRSSTASSQRPRDDSSGAPFSITIFMYEEFLVDRKESFLITRRLSSLLYNVGALPSYVHHIS